MYLILLIPGKSPAMNLRHSHADSYASAVVVSGTYAYLATSIVGPYDLHILDISDPYHPRLIGGINTDGAYRDIALQGNIMYVANEWGLSLIDVSNQRRQLKSDLSG